MSNENQVEKKQTKKKDQVKVFLSHRSDDRPAVEELKNKLEELSAEKLKCFQSSAPGEIKAGEDWRKRIDHELSDADALFLIFTDPSQTWDWCLYEVGLFTDLKRPEEGKMIICISSYEGEPPPSPLRYRQFVQATFDGLKQFLNDIFRKENFFPGRDAINKGLQDQTIKDLAQNLADRLLKRSAQVTYYTKCLRLHIDDPSVLKEKDYIPSDARIEPYDDCLKLFGMVESPPIGGKPHWLWEDLLKNIGERNCHDDATTWGQAIARMIYSAKEGQLFQQEGELFKSANTQDFFRPILTRFDVNPNGSIIFYLILVKQLKSHQ